MKPSINLGMDGVGAPASMKTSVAKIDGKTIELSNLEKIMHPHAASPIVASHLTRSRKVRDTPVQQIPNLPTCILISP
jgi:hypothetical protein